MKARPLGHERDDSLAPITGGSGDPKTGGIGCLRRRRRLIAAGVLYAFLLIAAGCGDGSNRTASVAVVQGMPVDAQLDSQPLWALVAGNDVEADRINVVFTGWGWDDPDALPDFVREVISWEGDAYLTDAEGWPTAASAAAVHAELGLFGIEPFRSHRDRFNLWYSNVEPDTPTFWLNQRINEPGPLTGPDPFELPDKVIVTLAWDAERVIPGLTSVSGQDGYFDNLSIEERAGRLTRPAEGAVFANTVVVVNSGYPAADLVLIPHELGHALFGFPDEYVGERVGFDGRLDLSSWPSCAEDETEARAWWGELLGAVDSMASIYEDELNATGVRTVEPGSFDNEVRVKLVDGGCYGVPGSYRATENSLMNDYLPVMGAVLRRHAEKILDLWSG